MKVVYIAGPFRANLPWHVELNVREAELWSAHVARVGGVPLCPHTMYRFFDKMQPDEFWLEATSELLRRVDAVLMLPEWELSEGAREEMQLAIRLETPVFLGTEFQALIEWLKE